MTFLLNQLHFLVKPPREYPISTIRISTQLLLNGRRSYQTVRNFLSLPHPRTIIRHFGGLSNVGHVDEARRTLMAVIPKLSGMQLQFCLLFDEVYVKPSIIFRGGHVIGHAEDVPNMPAKTVLAIMAKPLLSSHHKSFVIRLVPVFSLKSDFLVDILEKTVSLVKECGARVIALIADSASPNVKASVSFAFQKRHLGLGLFLMTQCIFFMILFILRSASETIGYRKKQNS